MIVDRYRFLTALNVHNLTGALTGQPEQTWTTSVRRAHDEGHRLPQLEERPMKISVRTLAIGAAILAAVFSTGITAVSAQATPATHFHPFTIVSPNFGEDTFLPVSVEFGGPGSAGSGCRGQNLAPTLHWLNVPSGTKSFAFIITDVDAPVADGFHHWIVYNIPRQVTSLRGHGSNP